MSTIRFVDAEAIRAELTKDELIKIQKMYKDILSSIKSRVEILKNSQNISSAMQLMYLSDLESQINKSLSDIEKELNKSIKDAMEKVAKSVVEDNEKILKEMGLKIKGAYSFVPDSIVRNIITGQLYDKDWSLSGAIWKHTKKSQSDIEKIIAEGIAQNKSTYDIAKDLEKYVNPTAKKPWDWSKIYPGVNKKIDYNAFRLANTMISHAYQQAFIATTKDNPFFTGYKWITSNSHRGTCELCLDRAGTDKYGLGIGVFPKSELPIDHPNGVCVYALVMTKSMSQVADDIAKWYNGSASPSFNSAMDKFIKSMEVSV